MYYIISKSDEELFHYGIPRRSGRYPYGSGEKPFQSVSRKSYNKALRGFERSDEFLKERMIKKGTLMYRVIPSENEKKTGSTYVTYLDVDRDLYKAGYVADRERTSNVYEKKMELTEDLKIPSRSLVRETVLDIAKEEPKMMYDCIRSYVKTFDKTGDNLTQKGLEYVENRTKDILNTQLDSSDADETMFNACMFTLGYYPNMKKEIISRLEKQGYNAMVDEYGVGKDSVEGVDPLIVFDYNKSLKDVETKAISFDDEGDAYDRYSTWWLYANDDKPWKKNWIAK